MNVQPKPIQSKPIMWDEYVYSTPEADKKPKGKTKLNEEQPTETAAKVEKQGQQHNHQIIYQKIKRMKMVEEMVEEEVPVIEIFETPPTKATLDLTIMNESVSTFVVKAPTSSLFESDDEDSVAKAAKAVIKEYEEEKKGKTMSKFDLYTQHLPADACPTTDHSFQCNF
jgi:hypothetical protein